ncbi:hypothetical protein COV19_02990 [Candidatus Woesearchaeota archaeon CG10_big_fil_rev_8_21_14_0_10_44_13]|nr:MAG: hypothetical protein COV19_02990 [Candidatus Woesearchaeota archaeon CG10_big_fil_rev_8_21_14_0_10_44_13]
MKAEKRGPGFSRDFSSFGRPAGKKGQITLFIILGIVLIFSTAIIIFIKAQAKEQMPQVPTLTESLPEEIRPVRDYVQECAYITAKDAIEMIGTSGGYLGVTPGSAQYTSKRFDLDITGMDPTSHEALTVSKDWHLPYWYFMKSENTCTSNCEFDTKRPPLLKTEGSDSIESQIDAYIAENIDECIDNFAAFGEEGYVVEKLGNISVRTMITDANVIIFIDYPFRVTIGDTSSKMTQYMATLDVNLKRIYNLAGEITTLAAENKFLEQHMLNVISGFSGMDEDALPPMAGTEFSFTSKKWLKSTVVRKIQDILAIYINLLQATQTENFRVNYFPDNSVKTGLYAQMVLPLEEEHYDTSVTFNYLGWPIYFYISPGEMISARDGVSVPIASLLVPFKRYDLPYDVSFPVMVELRDTTAYAGDGYSFFFALEANIRNNKPVTEDFVAFEQMTDVTAQMQLCNDNQKTSGDVTITTVDTQNKPLDGAMIYLSVGEVMCPMGETSLDSEGKLASFTGKFPMGAIGTLVVMHPDAAPYTREFFRAGKDAMKVDKIRLQKYVVKNATAMKMNINKYGGDWLIDPAPKPLGENEEAVIMLEKVKDNPNEPDVVAAASVKANERSEIRLVPGKYKMMITLLKDKSTIVMPKQTVGGQEVPETIVVANGVFPTEYEAYVIIDNSIYNAKEIRFNALYFNWLDVPQAERTLDDMEAWGNTTQYATENINYLSPVLS